MGAAVRLCGVSKRFANGVQALQNIDLRFEPGEVVAILGPSGAGKSTLLRMINGLETPSSGTIHIGETQVESKNVRAIRRQVGMVFQQFNLVPSLSVTANVLCGRLAYRNWMTSLLFVFPEEDHHLAKQAIVDVGLSGRDWDRVDRLSGGQQQRVAIARTIVQKPKVILADEPVASLDPVTSDDVLCLLVEQARVHSATLILNLHQVDLAKKFARRMIGLRQGSLQFDVPIENLSESGISELYKS